jgi:ATP-binding cassette subfamily F protein 3
MSILSVANVAKSFAADLLFSEITFSLAAGQKMGLIGRNGGGKTTLLRILLGQETPEPSIVGPLKTVVAPRVHLAAGRRLGYLRQEAPVHPEHTIGEEIEAALAPLRAVQERLAEAEQAMSAAGDDATLERAMADYSAAHDEFEARGGYQVEAERDAVLRRLGFGPAVMNKRVEACSGGEQTRLALAKLVLPAPTSSFWTNRPTTWTSPPPSGWKGSSKTIKARCFWSATTGTFWTPFVTISPNWKTSG